LLALVNTTDTKASSLLSRGRITSNRIIVLDKEYCP